MSGASFGAILAAVESATGVVATMHVGPKWMPSLDTAPPRIIVVRKSIDVDGQVGAIGGTPRSLGDDVHRCEAHLWTETEDDAEWLRRDFITALRQVVAGRNYDIASATWNEPAWSDLGVVLTLPFGVRMPSPARRLPTSSEAFSADDSTPTAAVDSVALLT